MQDVISLSGIIGDEAQPSLWQDRVRLDPGFWRPLREYPVPVREEAIKAIGTRSLAVDVHVWLEDEETSDPPCPPWVAPGRMPGRRAETILMVGAAALRVPAITARGLARQLRVTPQGALLLPRRLEEAEAMREARGRRSFAAYVIC